MAGLLLTIATFPGVIVHEMAHLLLCRAQGIPVRKVCYFRLGNPAGYVVHDEPATLLQDVLIGIGPFAVNSLVGGFVGMPGALAVLKHRTGTPIEYLLLWIGVSIAVHAFPSTGDAASIWRGLWSRPAPFIARLAGVPMVAFIYIGALSSAFRLNWLYGIGFVLFFPKFVVWCSLLR
ncbi:MAG: zinc metalloprotease [Armatimonadota bacterium]